MQLVRRAVFPLAWLLVVPGWSAAQAVPPPAGHTPITTTRAQATASPTASAAASPAVSSWTVEDPAGDVVSSDAMRHRFPRKAAAVDLRWQRHTRTAAGLTVVTRLHRVIVGKSPYQQLLTHEVTGRRDGKQFRVRFVGRVRGADEARTQPGGACAGVRFSVSTQDHTATAFIPAACLPRRIHRVSTVSFNEHDGADIASDQVSSVPD